jgi:hypothetical protein
MPIVAQRCENGRGERLDLQGWGCGGLRGGGAYAGCGSLSPAYALLVSTDRLAVICVILVVFFYDTTHIFLRCVENYTYTFACSIFLRYYPHFFTMCEALV